MQRKYFKERLLGTVLAASAGLACFQAEASQNRAINLKVNPVTLLLGFVVADLDFGLSERLTFGPSVAYWNLSVDSAKFKTLGYGAKFNYYLNGPRFTDSFYLQGGYSYLSKFKIESGGSSLEYKQASSASALLGYQWVFSSGFNICLGIGTAYGFGGNATGDSVVVGGDTISLKDLNLKGLSSSGEASIGWAF
jgi:hypothetical protein